MYGGYGQLCNNKITGNFFALQDIKTPQDDVTSKTVPHQKQRLQNAVGVVKLVCKLRLNGLSCHRLCRLFYQHEEETFPSV